MRLQIVDGYEELSIRAAGLVIDAIRRKPALALALPTGGTPVGMYQELVRAYERGQVDFSQVRLFNIDTYAGIPADSPHANRAYIMKHLASKVNIQESLWRALDSDPADYGECARRYEDAIKSAGGLDLVIDGLGHNGHFGYNEPGSSFESRTRLVKIADSTIAANSRFFERPEDIPRSGFTLGIATILEARKIVVLVSGAGKSEIVRRVVEGPVTEEVPMTAIRRHGDATMMVDRAAASRLCHG